MTMARDQVYYLINLVARKARQDIATYPDDHKHYTAVEGGSTVDDRLHELLNKVEEDRLHAEAQKLYDQHDKVLLTHGPDVAGGYAKAAIAIDPYLRDKDGNYTRKSDGERVFVEEQEKQT